MQQLRQTIKPNPRPYPTNSITIKNDNELDKQNSNRFCQKRDQFVPSSNNQGSSNKDNNLDQQDSNRLCDKRVQLVPSSNGQGFTGLNNKFILKKQYLNQSLINGSVVDEHKSSNNDDMFMIQLDVDFVKLLWTKHQVLERILKHKEFKISSPTTPYQRQQELLYKPMEAPNSAPTVSSFLPLKTTLHPPPIQYFFDFHKGKRDFDNLANRVIPNKQLLLIAKSYAYKLFGCATL